MSFSKNQADLFNRQTYSYDLPPDLIAQQALKDRSQSRLLIYDKRGEIHHEKFQNIGQFLPKNCLFVRNQSKVLPSRLIGKTLHGGKVELLLLEEENDRENKWVAMGRPLKKMKPGTQIHFPRGVVGTITSKGSTRADDVGTICVEFSELKPDDEFKQWLHTAGHVPLPPYIARKELKPASESADFTTYQTVYAKKDGSAAAPTAGLHFTETLIRDLEASGHEFADVTLHVGAGTFLPVKANDIRNHRMHEERYEVPSATLKKILQARRNHRPLIAVGTTSLRSLEAFAKLADGNTDRMQANCDKLHRTDLFIHPGLSGGHYKPFFANALLTNFHQPESSLFMLVSALLGTEKVHEIYQSAIQRQYRFFSYGDSSLLWL